MSTMILEPRVSEKAYGLSQNDNQVIVFNVPTSVNKLEIKQAVESQFSVAVADIKTIIQKGKVVRTIRLGKQSRSRAGQGRRVNVKKAYVTLKAGERIAIFDEPKEGREAKK